MHPEILTIPGTSLTIQSYGLMMVLGFISAIWIIRRLSRKITPDPQLITNAALYSLIAGVVGARLFYVVHYFGEFKGDLLSVFAIWKGGLELLGGVILAVTVIILYLIYHKLPIRKYLDILAIGLMAALMFGRIGCFCRSCCFGKPTDFPIAVRFPYASNPYYSQVFPNPQRNRSEPYMRLPDDYYVCETIDGNDFYGLKPFELLDEQQKYEVTKGKYRCLPVHPTQLYSSVSAGFVCLLLFLLWRRAQEAQALNKQTKFLAAPGSIFSLMFIFYGIVRFSLEFLRDDNPFEIEGIPLTVAQYIGLGIIVVGFIQLAAYTLYARMEANKSPKSEKQSG
ncbi:MAG: prolipoprotein diacylglyceryl transferase [Sedimentisphaerales bacterium]|nr:prolipoprotein diacylglyceryl transferase [Sedimentisphaerales bacterium]